MDNRNPDAFVAIETHELNALRTRNQKLARLLKEVNDKYEKLEACSRASARFLDQTRLNLLGDLKVANRRADAAKDQEEVWKRITGIAFAFGCLAGALGSWLIG